MLSVNLWELIFIFYFCFLKVLIKIVTQNIDGFVKSQISPPLEGGD